MVLLLFGHDLLNLVGESAMIFFFGSAPLIQLRLLSTLSILEPNMYIYIFNNIFISRGCLSEGHGEMTALSFYRISHFKACPIDMIFRLALLCCPCQVARLKIKRMYFLWCPRPTRPSVSTWRVSRQPASRCRLHRTPVFRVTFSDNYLWVEVVTCVCVCV